MMMTMTMWLLSVMIEEEVVVVEVEKKVPLHLRLPLRWWTHRALSRILIMQEQMHTRQTRQARARAGKARSEYPHVKIEH